MRQTAGADLWSAALDVPLAALTAAVAVHWRQADQCGDLMAIDGPEFGQLGDEGTGDDVADAWDGLQQVLLGAEDRAGGDQLVDGVLDAGDLGLETAQHGGARPTCEDALGAIMALLFGACHDHELMAPRQQSTQLHGLLIGQRSRRGTDGLDKVRDVGRINAIALGEPSQSAGELAGLAWIDHGDRQARVATVTAS